MTARYWKEKEDVGTVRRITEEGGSVSLMVKKGPEESIEAHDVQQTTGREIGSSRRSGP